MAAAEWAVERQDVSSEAKSWQRLRPDTGITDPGKKLV